MRKWFGVDEYRSRMSLTDLLSYAKRHRWHLYDVDEKDGYTVCYANVFDRKRMKESGKGRIRLVRTTGWIGFLLRESKDVRCYLALLCSMAVWLMLSHTVFSFTFKGDDPTLQKQMRDYLTSEYALPYFSWNSLQGPIESRLAEAFELDVTWLDVTQMGSEVQISYAKKETAKQETFGYEPLIATKNAMIAAFDIQHGHKCVAPNDYVEAGDVLVDDILVDSNQQEKRVYVKGRVYGYTWYDIQASFPRFEGSVDALDYVRLLMNCRDQISKELQKTEKIITESVIQWNLTKDRAFMQVHYTLYEDITIP